MKTLSKFLDQLSNFFAQRKGLLPALGILLVILNFAARLFLTGWLAESDVLLHVGIVAAILGFLLAWAL
jgi:hypothetical protein